MSSVFGFWSNSEKSSWWEWFFCLVFHPYLKENVSLPDLRARQIYTGTWKVAVIFEIQNILVDRSNEADRQNSQLLHSVSNNNLLLQSLTSKQTVFNCYCAPCWSLIGLAPLSRPILSKIIVWCIRREWESDFGRPRPTLTIEGRSLLRETQSKALFLWYWWPHFVFFDPWSCPLISIVW